MELLKWSMSVVVCLNTLFFFFAWCHSAFMIHRRTYFRYKSEKSWLPFDFVLVFNFKKCVLSCYAVANSSWNAWFKLNKEKTYTSDESTLIRLNSIIKPYIEWIRRKCQIETCIHNPTISTKPSGLRWHKCFYSILSDVTNSISSSFCKNKLIFCECKFFLKPSTSSSFDDEFVPNLVGKPNSFFHNS